MSRSALLFGFNYDNNPDFKLNGCINDALHFSELLKTHGWVDVNCITDDIRDNRYKCTKAGMLLEMHRLALKSWTNDLELAWISYSGHGTYEADATDGDEEDGQDEGLVPTDYYQNGMVSDDELHFILSSFNPQTRILIIIDACHSGTMGDLNFRFPDIKTRVTEHDRPIRSSVLMLSGCKDNDYSADAHDVLGKGKFTGAFSSCLLLALEENEQNMQNVFSLTKRCRELLLEKEFTQVAQVSASYDLQANPNIGMFFSSVFL